MRAIDDIARGGLGEAPFVIPTEVEESLDISTSLDMTRGHPMIKRLTFPKTRRLARPAEFDRVRKEGRTERGKFLMLGYLQEGDFAFRAGFITSRTIGRAVVRNRVRRRLREIVRKHQHEIRAGVWVVTIARAAAASATSRELEGEWLRLAGRASILGA